MRGHSAIPGVDHRFEIDHEEAKQMWETGKPMPGEKPQLRDKTKTIRQSNDGQWVVRKKSIIGFMALVSETAGEVKSLFIDELDRLQEMGLHVVSFAMSASDPNREVITVSPWIPDIEVCPESTFSVNVDPILLAYIRELNDRESPRPDLTDIYGGHQYSLAPSVTPNPFLHDIGIEILMD